MVVGAFFVGPLLAGLILDRLTANAYRVRWPTDGHSRGDREGTNSAGEPRGGRHRSRPTVIDRDASDTPTQPLPQPGELP
ncbi:MAG: hypothetical protein M3308_00960 [Actinomycetota bacterium]|nr:hypothetical protein [Actinomycetota bacterium]